MVATLARLTALCTLLALAGCVKRTEKITVLEDGRVQLEVVFEGDPADVLGGDAVPASATGWAIRDRRVKDAEDKKTLERQATRTVEWARMPSSYAVHGSAADDLALQFPTSITVETRRDGTYYHFKRTYQRRDNGAEQRSERIMEADEVKDVAGKEPDTLTEADQLVVVDALIAAHRAKELSFVDAAIAACSERIAQDALLQARRRVDGVFEGLVDEVLPIIQQEDDHDDAEQLDDLEERLAETMQQAVRESLSSAGVLNHHIAAFCAAVDQARGRHRVTTDLADEQWLVALKLPGEIVAHNGVDPNEEFLSEVADGGKFNLFWKFEGQDLYDGDVVLMATSRVSHVTAAPANGS